jgi:hypothetical protein
MQMGFRGRSVVCVFTVLVLFVSAVWLHGGFDLRTALMLLGLCFACELVDSGLAHNLKVGGSNPSPAPIFSKLRFVRKWSVLRNEVKHGHPSFARSASFGGQAHLRFLRKLPATPFRLRRTSRWTGPF